MTLNDDIAAIPKVELHAHINREKLKISEQIKCVFNRKLENAHFRLTKKPLKKRGKTRRK